MRRFLLVAHDARTDGGFPLDDLPGSAGRMDLVARCVATALLISHEVRRDVEFAALLLGPPRPPRLVRFVGEEVRSLNPDERSVAALIRKAVAAEGLAEHSPHPGVYASGRGLAEAIATVPPGVVRLVEGGRDLRGARLPRDPTFVLADHRELSPEEESIVRAKAHDFVSVGPKSLHADQVIAIVHNELDRRS